MIALLDTPFVNSRAAELSLVHELAPLPALGTHTVRVPGGTVELRVLGASHQVLAALGAVDWSETVACLPDRDGRLPDRDETAAGRLRSRFVSRRERLTPAAFGERVDRIRARCDEPEDALIGTFPGSPLAITALRVWPLPAGGVTWSTWHAYPQTGELVHTTTVLEAR